MEAWVDEAVIRDAIADGLADPALGSPQQWAAVADYLEGRGPDPWPARRARLAGGDVALTELRAWHAQDVATAAPLMGAFTSHDTSIEHAVVRVDPAEVGRVATWLGGRLGAEVQQLVV